MTHDVLAQLQSALGADYSIEREIGGGGMSRVYVVSDVTLNRRVVVKLLPLELGGAVSIARFRREITLAASLKHPHIVPVLSSGEIQGLPYYTMPFVDGESLRERLDRDGELPVAEAVRLLRQIATALGYAHEQGIVHRDIKPRNILLSDGVALVADFGVAKAVVASAVAGASLTSTGIAVGTPAYMSPEQVTADPNLDHRADLYAFGLIAYEMLAGSSPFAGRKGQAMLSAHAVETPEPLERRRRTVPPALASLVMRCLEKRRADRPQDANEIIAVLDALATTPMPERTTPVSRPRRVSVGRLFAVALCLVVASGLTWLLFRNRASQIRPPRLLVAPFTNLTGDPALNYIGPSAADQLTTMVGQLGSMDVVASNTVLGALRDTTRSAADQLKRLSDAMHASLLVTGTYSRRGDSLAMNVQITDVRRNVVVHTFFPFAVSMADPAKAVAAIGDRLLGWLSMQGITVLPRAGFRAPSAAAFQDFAKAYDAFFVKARPREARPFLERVIALDSSYVRAYLLLFGAYYYAGDSARADSILRRVERLPKPFTVGEQALIDFLWAQLRGELNAQLNAQSRLAALDSSPESLQSVAMTANALLQPKLAIFALERSSAASQVVGGAVAGRQGHFLAEAYHLAGRYDDQLRVVRDARARESHIGGPLGGLQLGAYGALGGRGDEASALADSMFGEAGADSTGEVLVFVMWGIRESRAHGDAVAAARLLKRARDWMASHPVSAPRPVRQLREGIILLASGLADSAARRFEAAASDPGQRLNAIGHLGLAHIARGDTARARAIADSLAAILPSTGNAIWRAAIVGALGDRSRAVDLLKNAAAAGVPMNSWHSHIAFESLRGYPEFEKLVRPKT